MTGRARFRRHNWRSFVAYGWRERSSVIGAVLVAAGLYAAFGVPREVLAEFGGRLVELGGIMGGLAVVGRGILGVMRDTTAGPQP